MRALILASTSPYRLAQLERLGIPVRALAPKVDEEALKDEGLGPRALAERLALAKAESLRDDWPTATIVGGDQLVAFRGRIFGKPGTASRAIDQLATLAGQSHELITALAVIDRNRVHRHTDVATLAMRALSLAELRRYVRADRPIDCAGSYKLEQRGIALFERIESEDHSAITGLPLMALTSILREIGFRVP